MSKTAQLECGELEFSPGSRVLHGPRGWRDFQAVPPEKGRLQCGILPESTSKSNSTTWTDFPTSTDPKSSPHITRTFCRETRERVYITRNRNNFIKLILKLVDSFSSPSLAASPGLLPFNNLFMLWPHSLPTLDILLLPNTTVPHHASFPSHVEKIWRPSSSLFASYTHHSIGKQNSSPTKSTLPGKERLYLINISLSKYL